MKGNSSRLITLCTYNAGIFLSQCNSARVRRSLRWLAVAESAEQKVRCIFSPRPLEHATCSGDTQPPLHVRSPRGEEDLDWGKACLGTEYHECLQPTWGARDEQNCLPSLPRSLDSPQPSDPHKVLRLTLQKRWVPNETCPGCEGV